MGFQATIADVFELGFRAGETQIVLLLQAFEGEAKPGDRFQTKLGSSVVEAIDDRGISATDCLLGRPIEPCLAIKVLRTDWLDRAGQDLKILIGLKVVSISGGECHVS